MLTTWPDLFWIHCLPLLMMLLKLLYSQYIKKTLIGKSGFFWPIQCCSEDINYIFLLIFSQVSFICCLFRIKLMNSVINIIYIIGAGCITMQLAISEVFLRQCFMCHLLALTSCFLPVLPSSEIHGYAQICNQDIILILKTNYKVLRISTAHAFSLLWFFSCFDYFLRLVQ